MFIALVSTNVDCPLRRFFLIPCGRRKLFGCLSVGVVLVNARGRARPYWNSCSLCYTRWRISRSRVLVLVRACVAASLARLRLFSAVAVAVRPVVPLAWYFIDCWGRILGLVGDGETATAVRRCGSLVPATLLLYRRVRVKCDAREILCVGVLCVRLFFGDHEQSA